jgi:tryptophan synthase alpha subunit
VLFVSLWFKGMSRIGKRFEELRQRQELGLVAYITAGDPDLRATAEFIPALEEAGVDVLELGVPFSDPLADGPVIQRASQRWVRERRWPACWIWRPKPAAAASCHCCCSAT